VEKKIHSHSASPPPLLTSAFHSQSTYVYNEPDPLGFLLQEGRSLLMSPGKRAHVNRIFPLTNLNGNTLAYIVGVRC